jgi:hypothetical protein
MNNFNENVESLRNIIKKDFYKKIKKIHPDHNSETNDEAVILIKDYKEKLKHLEKYDKVNVNLYKYIVIIKGILNKIIRNEEDSELLDKIVKLNEIKIFSNVNLQLLFQPGKYLRYPNILTIYKLLSKIADNYCKYYIKDNFLFKELFFTNANEIRLICKNYNKKPITEQIILFIYDFINYIGL